MGNWEISVNTIRSDMRCSVVLYHTPDFFAVVWYLIKAVRVGCEPGFESKKRLELYLDKIHLKI